MSPVYGFGEAADKFIEDMKTEGVAVKKICHVVDDIVKPKKRLNWSYMNQ